MGHYFFSKGYDVWIPNLRGHGTDNQRSTVRGKQKYSFKYIVGDDIPLIVDHVFKTTGKKITIIGHSMGGMAAKAYLAGIQLNENEKIIVDEGKAKALSKEKIQSLVVIGTPPHFKHLPFYIKILTRLFPHASERFQMNIPLPSKMAGSGSTTNENIYDSSKRKLFQKLDHLVLKFPAFHKVMNTKNLEDDRHELTQLIEKGMSPVSEDLVKDINSWTQTGKILSDDGFNFSMVRKVFVPILFIAGEEDGIASAKEIFKEAKEYQKLTHVCSILIPETSHVDLIAGKRAANLVGNIMVKFIKSPKKLKSNYP